MGDCKHDEKANQEYTSNNAIDGKARLYTAGTYCKARAVGIRGNGHNNLDVVGRGAALEVALGFDHVLYTTMAVPLNHTLDPDEWFDMLQHAKVSVCIAICY
jgi:hypothetical protein